MPKICKYKENREICIYMLIECYFTLKLIDFFKMHIIWTSNKNIYLHEISYYNNK